MEHNPYQAPRTALDAARDSRQIVPAGNWRRFGTLLVDYVCFLLCAVVAGVVIALLFGSGGINAMQGPMANVVSLLLLLGYYIFFEGLWARTPGKWLCGTVVVDENGDPPSFGQVVGRSFCRLIPFEALSFFGERGWHDSIPRTHVVMAR